MSGLRPNTKVPDLEVATVGGAVWRLADRNPELFTLIEVYRGLHCPRCHKHLLDLQSKLDRFAERGVEVIAISTDGEERAAEAKESWGLARLTIGYGLTLDRAREWGLYISSAIAEAEPRRFSEPGMFLVRPDATLYSAIYNTTPFNRPHFADVLESLDMVRARNYPARGDAD